MIRRILIYFLIKLLNRELPQREGLRDEMRIKMLARAYQNPALTTYLDAREKYVINEAMNQFINGKLDGPKGLAGQLVEIRNLRTHMKACWDHQQRSREKTTTREKLKQLRKRK